MKYDITFANAKTGNGRIFTVRDSEGWATRFDENKGVVSVRGWGHEPKLTERHRRALKKHLSLAEVA